MAVKCILTGQTPSVLDGVTENVQTQLNDKVDKVTGKGLSTNDYTSAEKTKLSGIETGAQKNTITGVKGNAETTYRTGNVNITATNIGLGNVNNTSDAEKPISTATQTALDGKQATITGAATTITDNNLTANRALISNSSGKVAVSAVTSTELGYLDGVTSNIQTQLDSKLSSAPVTSVNKKTGAVSLEAKDVGAQPSISANGILKGDGSGNITAANETEVELVSLPNICNPNLLDNWYFGNPVDQRAGWVVPPNVMLYEDADLTVEKWPSGTSIPVTFINDTVAHLTGFPYYCKRSACIRGYATSEYAIDRWRIGSSGTLTIQNGYITFSSNDEIGRNLEEYLDDFPAGTYTLSALVENGADARLIAGANDTFYAANISDDSKQVVSVTFVKTTTGRVTVYLQSINKAVSWFAVKLELGSQQTLAHQENGAWVLNEIPDYGEQLRRCQRYYWKVDHNNWPGVSPFSGTYNGERITLNGLTFPVTMRTKPTISNLILYENGSGSSKTVTDSGWGLFDYTYNNIFPTSGDLVSGHTYSVQQVEFSADL